MGGNTWEKDNLKDCPIRMLTVLKDRMSGHVINRGIQLYFEESTKRISDNNVFDWKLEWEGNTADRHGFMTMPNDFNEEIPF